jgi:hypothetical protein
MKRSEIILRARVKAARVALANLRVLMTGVVSAELATDAVAIVNAQRAVENLERDLSLAGGRRRRRRR